MAVFLAHAKSIADELINQWVEHLSAAWHTAVVAGRDDYLKRSRALGGWNTWVRDVPIAEDWSGDALFFAIVVPVQHFDNPTIGSATQALVRGFLAAKKSAYAWNPETLEYAEIIDVVDTTSDSWQDAGMLVFST